MERIKGKHIKLKRIIIIIVVTLFMCAILIALNKANYWNLIPQKSYTAEDFGVETLVSKSDVDADGIDDFLDIMNGARKYVKTKPIYKSEYYGGGYPPEGIGVCTDVIWEAFDNAGYSLKDLVDKDISENKEVYTSITKADPNIDFRRVKNLKIFFDNNAQLLTLNPTEIEEWQPGDIVIYPNHIAIVSDKRNKAGKVYIIHNAGQPVLEEDALTRDKIIGHYRWCK